MRGATCPPIVCVSIPVFQSTLLMRGATVVVECLTPRLRISIHAPHARSALAEKAVTPHYTFQSTLLMRGATWRVACRHPIHDFNPRSSCEERHPAPCTQTSAPHFNPRSSCEERRIYQPPTFTSKNKFQSTLLMRGATSRSVLTHRACAKFQSTLLMRGATCHLRLFRRRADFNPRSSCEERLHWSMHALQIAEFQSTLLMRGAT